MATTAVKVPPQDIEMERALLGALMLNQNAIYEVADLVGVDSFYAGKHRTIFDAMLALFAKGEPIDVVTLSSKLKERKLQIGSRRPRRGGFILRGQAPHDIRRDARAFCKRRTYRRRYPIEQAQRA